MDDRPATGPRSFDRRRLLAGIGGALTAGTAGCAAFGDGNGDGADGTTADPTGTTASATGPTEPTATTADAATATTPDPASFDLVVSKDGDGDHATVQAAVDAVPDESDTETRILIRRGRYREKLTVPQEKQHVTFVGEGAAETVLTYDDHANKLLDGEPMGTSNTPSVVIDAPDFTARDLAFENAAEPVAQAVAALVEGKRASFERCRFLGNQDTLFADGAFTTQYYRDCYVEGDVDFIFGGATAVFEGCEIFCKAEGGYVTAASTVEEKPFGYVFLDCEVTGNAADDSYYLGRPWEPFANVAFVDSYLGDHVHPAGWHNWDSPMRERFARYAEFGNRGPGYVPDERVEWSEQLTRTEVLPYLLEAARVKAIAHHR